MNNPGLHNHFPLFLIVNNIRRQSQAKLGTVLLLVTAYQFSNFLPEQRPWGWFRPRNGPQFFFSY
jgi:hypothetical protein